MSEPARWNLEEFRSLLRMQAQHLNLHPKLKRRFDWSDLAQEAMLRAHASLAQFQGKTRAELVGWLLTILKNTYRDVVDKGFAGKRDPSREQYLDHADDSLRRMSGLIDPHQATPSRQAEQDEMLVNVAAALDELPEDERQVIILRYLVGETLAAIAEQVDRPQTTVSRLVMRGLERLRNKLSPAAPGG